MIHRRTQRVVAPLLGAGMLLAGACAPRSVERAVVPVVASTPSASPSHSATAALRDTLAHRVATLELRRASVLSGYLETAPEVQTLSAQIDGLTAQIAQLPATDRVEAQARIVSTLHARRAAVQTEIAERRATLARDTPTVSRLVEEDSVLAARVRQIQHH